ncbi:hypothetical protein NLM27_08895 [Bradyrhizobium sp. CCGB12]|uniref:class I SAM-dependent methyltransferase n=1 Tax=Bradyrhizobium sp. CCGB12 TaxID=2949632 RepID=UPI0020B2F59C|nr:hypothetical protein [Bradyrhizobium sp. CCGB12]MCP3388889.1 hypothetical protein [Bradyrhizobium sp. CCGB12]
MMGIYLKPLLKRVLPAPAYRTWWRTKIWVREKRLRNLSRTEVFDTIYRDNMWGGPDKLSGYGSSGPHAAAYIDFVKRFAKEKGVRTVLDGGCGDFSIGSQICDCVESYIATDISDVIIGVNKVRHSAFKNVEFRRLDLCVDPLPPADLITIREVFQHLSNADIALALANIEKSSARYVLITEHVPADHRLMAPNLDKPRGSQIRNMFGSGVYINLPPFNRPAEAVFRVEHPSTAWTSASNLVTSLWKRQPQ